MMDVASEHQRFELPKHLQPQLRLYRRLYLARIDLEEAKAAVTELLDRRIPLPRSKPPSALLLSLTTGLVVAYARSFIHTRGQSVVAERAVPGSLLRGLTARERELHEALLDLRNKEVAHSDAEILDISIRLHVDGDGAIFRNIRAPFSMATLRAVLHLVEKLESALDQRCEELRTELPLEVWL